MRELRRPYAPVRGVTRKELAEASKPQNHAPARPGREQEVPVMGVSGTRRFDVIGEND